MMSLSSLQQQQKLFIQVIPNDRMFVSEPDPRRFGNGPNPPVQDPSWTHWNWLQTRFHFSFGDAYDNEQNERFGVLRVLNDDLIQPQRGFATHGHANMEIITYIVHGTLTHLDNINNNNDNDEIGESLSRGSIQFMTAGTGIEHSEFNHEDVPLRVIQVWIFPDQGGLTPRYGSYNTVKQDLSSSNKNHYCSKNNNNKLQHLVSSIHETTVSTPVKIHQNVNAYACELELHQQVSHTLSKGRQAYLVCIEGGILVNGKELSKYDACEIVFAKEDDKSSSNDHGEAGAKLTIEAIDVEETENGNLAHFLIYTMPEVIGSGRKDL